MKLMVPVPSGVSARETHRLMGRGISAFALLLVLQASGSIATQAGFAAPWWDAAFLWLFLGALLCFMAAAVRGRGLLWTSALLAFLVLAGLVLWPMAVPPEVPEDIGTPWLWAMINVGAAWSAFAFGTVTGCVYTVVIGGVFAAIRLCPRAGQLPCQSPSKTRRSQRFWGSSSVSPSGSCDKLRSGWIPQPMRQSTVTGKLQPKRPSVTNGPASTDCSTIAS